MRRLLSDRISLGLLAAMLLGLGACWYLSSLASRERALLASRDQLVRQIVDSAGINDHAKVLSLIPQYFAGRVARPSSGRETQLIELYDKQLWRWIRQSPDATEEAINAHVAQFKAVIAAQEERSK